jgi:Ca2+-transporting ATPase
VFVSIILGWAVPLVPIQLLWLNLVTDSFPAMALGVEPAEPNIMNEKPRNTKEQILDKSMYGGIIFQAIAISGASLLAYYWAMEVNGGLVYERTIVFTTLITAELLRAFSSRSQDYTLFKIGLFTNKAMIKAFLVSFGLTLAVIYIPFLANIFNLVALSITDWEIVLSFAFFPLIVGEIYKIEAKNK